MDLERLRRCDHDIFSKVAVGSYVMAAVARDRFGALFFCFFCFDIVGFEHSSQFHADGFNKLEALGFSRSCHGFLYTGSFGGNTARSHCGPS